ncbi:MAG TPA: hypothetical protein VK102_11535 [Sphingobacterium sp.]|nr:hypothetical protein [Sphingobacterium sp.]
MKLCTLQVSAPQAYQNKPHNPDSRIKDNFPANETHKTGKKKAIEININEKRIKIYNKENNAGG